MKIAETIENIEKIFMKNILLFAIKNTCKANAYMLSLVYKIKRKMKGENLKMSNLTEKKRKKGIKQ